MNGIIQFEVGDQTYTCRFGMKAAEIFSKSLIRIEGETGEVTAWDWFVALLHAGLCNENYSREQPFTSFLQASTLADEISLELQSEIYECYEQSRAGKEIQAKIDALLPKEKKSAQSPKNQQSPKQRTGKKLRSTPIQTD